MKKKIPVRQFRDGERVVCSKGADTVLMIKCASWNGYSYMYSFEDTELRCGEEYLSPLYSRYKHSSVK